MSPWSRRPWFRRARRASVRVRRQRETVYALRAACAHRNVRALEKLLAHDVELLVDSGGTLAAEHSSAQGAADVATTLLQILSTSALGDLVEADVNGTAGLVIRTSTSVIGVLTVELSKRAIGRVWMVLNPDKLGHWNR